MALTNPIYTVDTTFSGKNIASAASVYQFTAAATAKIRFTVKLNDAAGGGDYVVYLTRQWGGVGTAAVVLPKTTTPAAAGETVIEFMTGAVDAKVGDVVNVMVDGLAGDTNVSGAIRIVADNPSVFDASADAVTAGTVSDKSGYGLADGAITAAKLAADALTAAKIAADAITEIQAGLMLAASYTAPPSAGQVADAVWDETLAAHLGAGSAGEALDDAGGGGGSAADIWSYANRTLTQSAAQVAAAVAGATITITRGDSLSATLTVPDNSGYVSIDFTAKRSTMDSDDDAVIRIRKNASGLNDGLLRLNKAAPAAASDGAITVNSATSITITLAAGVTDDLGIESNMAYDVQYITATGVHTAALGVCNVAADVTRAIS